MRRYDTTNPRSSNRMTGRSTACAVRVLFCALAPLSLSGSLFAAEFIPICPRGGAVPYRLQREGIGLSADGRVLVGGGRNPVSSDPEPFRWSAADGLSFLGHYGRSADQSGTSSAYAVSDNGSIVVGSSYVNTYHFGSFPIDEISGFRWASGSMTALPWLSGDDEAYPLALTADGSVAVGYSYEDSHTLFARTLWVNAVRWINGSPQDLGSLPIQGAFSDDDAYALATSADGSTIVGQSGEIDDYWRPFVWIDGQISPLATLADASCGVTRKFYSCNEALDVSPDGQVAVGKSFDGVNTLPVWWSTTQRTPTTLQLLGGDASGFARCVSRPVDGKGWVIGGKSGTTPVLWDTNTGHPITLETLFRSLRLEDEIRGWSLYSIDAISDDARTLAGYGVHPNGETWVWYADLRDPPLNDDCENAQFIGEGVFPSYRERSTTGTTFDATSDGASTCGFGGGPDVWYEFSATEAGYLELSVCGSELLNPVISVHRGCPGGSATQVFCANDCDDFGCDGACIDPPWVRIEPGEKYLVRVASDPSAPGGLFTLVSRFVPDADDCVDAPLVTVPSTTGGITTLATTSPAESCGDFQHTAPGVWYRVIGTGTTMIASLCGAADYDTRMTLYCGGCENPTCLTQDDDGCAGELTSEITWCSAPGQQYYILVHGYGNQTGTFDLSVSSSGGPCGLTWNCSPDNDDCDGALPLSAGTTLVDNGSAQTVLGGTACAGIGNDLWHAYTPTCSGDVLIDTCQSELGTLSDTVLSVLGGCDGVEIGCNDDYDDGQLSCGRRSVVEVRATAGEELLIRSGGYQTFQETGTYPLRVTEVPDPVSVPDWWIDVPQAAPIGFHIGISGGCPPFITAEGNGYFVSASGLPEGLAVDSYGYLYGSYPYSGMYRATIDVADREITTPGDTSTLDFRFVATNDDCALAMSISEGSYPFGTHTLSTDGPTELEACAPAGLQTIERDQWFRYMSSCDGIATIDVCEGALDATVAVYDGGDCPSEPSAIACEHPACGTSPRMRMPVERGAEYLIRVGGYAGAEDNGVLTVTCFDDCNGNEIADALEIDALAGSFPNGDSPADCNGNRRLDVCESLADANGDGSVSSADWISIRACLTAPCSQAGCAPPAYTRECCDRFDMNSDGDVDMNDASEWIRQFEDAASN